MRTPPIFFKLRSPPPSEFQKYCNCARKVYKRRLLPGIFDTKLSFKEKSMNLVLDSADFFYLHIKTNQI